MLSGAVALLASLSALLGGEHRIAETAHSPDYDCYSALPVVINTWPFTDATEAAWDVLRTGRGRAAVDAAQAGAAACERLQCDGTVGFGGSPDEKGETTLDALIFDGDTLGMGAVANLRHLKDAAAAARLILDHTTHSMLAGLQASIFAQSLGLQPSNLTTEGSAALHAAWRAVDCQPNFWTDVAPNPRKQCGPYHLRRKSDGAEEEEDSEGAGGAGAWPRAGTAHDTIAVLTVDGAGSMAAACSTNGAIHKVPGRVGDCAVAGAGAYADSQVGACGATGDGDVHLRFLPCYQTVENMRRGMGPREAAEEAVGRIAARLGGAYVGAVVALSRDGRHGAAAHGWNFSYSVRDTDSGGVQVVAVEPLALPAGPGAGRATA